MFDFREQTIFSNVQTDENKFNSIGLKVLIQHRLTIVETKRIASAMYHKHDKFGFSKHYFKTFS